MPSERHEMKVKFAAQALSASVTDALSFLMAVDERFWGAGATIEFIRSASLTKCMHTSC